jgi:hypothetical protein
MVGRLLQSTRQMDMLMHTETSVAMVDKISWREIPIMTRNLLTFAKTRRIEKKLPLKAKLISLHTFPIPH